MAKSSTKPDPVDLSSDIPQQRHLVAKSGTVSGQLDIWPAFGSGYFKLYLLYINKEAEGLMAQLTMFQFQPNKSVVVASIRTFCFLVLNIAIIYKTTFVMPEIHSCSVHHSIYDHFCSDSTMSPWKLK